MPAKGSPDTRLSVLCATFEGITSVPGRNLSFNGDVITRLSGYRPGHTVTCCPAAAASIASWIREKLAPAQVELPELTMRGFGPSLAQPGSETAIMKLNITRTKKCL